MGETIGPASPVAALSPPAAHCDYAQSVELFMLGELNCVKMAIEHRSVVDEIICMPSRQHREAANERARKSDLLDLCTGKDTEVILCMCIPHSVGQGPPCIDGSLHPTSLSRSISGHNY